MPYRGAKFPHVESVYGSPSGPLAHSRFTIHYSPAWVECAALDTRLEYFVIGPNGERFGPANFELLNQWAKQGRVNNETSVEEAGTGQRMKITSVPGFTAAPPVSKPLYQGATKTPYVENHLVKAILVTLCCCLPLGIVAIVYASQVEGYARRGDTEAANEASDKASTWANWALWCGLVIIALRLLVLISAGSSNAGPFR